MCETRDALVAAWNRQFSNTAKRRRASPPATARPTGSTGGPVARRQPSPGRGRNASWPHPCSSTINERYDEAEHQRSGRMHQCQTRQLDVKRHTDDRRTCGASMPAAGCEMPAIAEIANIASNRRSNFSSPAVFCGVIRWTASPAGAGMPVRRQIAGPAAYCSAGTPQAGRGEIPGAIPASVVAPGLSGDAILFRARECASQSFQSSLAPQMCAGSQLPCASADRYGFSAAITAGETNDHPIPISAACVYQGIASTLTTPKRDSCVTAGSNSAEGSPGYRSTPQAIQLMDKR